MPEEVNQVPDINQFSGGLVNPLAKEQVRIEVPEMPVAPAAVGVPLPNTNPVNQIENPMDFALALKKQVENPLTYASDKYKYGRNYSYDADYTGLNFQRYYKVPSVYKNIGFSPWRDNEAIYNQKMSWWDAYKRSAGQWSNLASTGFSSMLPWNAWSDVGEGIDKDSAEAMERAHAIGHDSRGGASAFFNNMVVDSGYTFGILGELASEEAVIWGASTLAAPFTLGGSWAGAAVETGAAVSRASSLFSRIKNMSSLTKGVTKTWEGFKELASINKARQAFDYVKSGAPLGKLLEVITPGTVAFTRETMKAAKNGENIYNLARASKGVGAFYRDTREIAAAISEAKLEGGSTELRMRKDLVDKFYKDNGRMPESEDYEKIYQYAKDAAHETYLWNLPALYLSNKIVFNKALQGLKPFRAFREELSKGLSGKLVFDQAASAAGKEAWSVVQSGFRESAKSLTKASTYKPKNLLKNITGSIFKYGKANLTEGFQESYQDAVSNTMVDYYTSRYNDPTQIGPHDVWGMFAGKMGEQFTTSQGLETFASGFLMGGIVQGPQHLVYDWAPKKFQQIFKPEEHAEYARQREDRTNRVVNALNEVTKNADRFFNQYTNDVVSQSVGNKQSMDASQAGDTKGYVDIQDESIFEHLHTLLANNKLDLVTDYLKDMKSLSGEELEQAYGKLDPQDGDAKEFYTKKIDGMLDKASYIQKRYDVVNDKYANPFEPNKYSPTEDQKKFNDEFTKWYAWEESKKMAVFSSYSFDRSLERMKSIMDDIVHDKPLAKANSSDFTVLFDENQIKEEIKSLKTEVSTLKDISGTVNESRKREKKLDALTGMRDSVTEYQTALASEDEALTTEALKGLHKSYKNYLRVIADQSDDYMFNAKVDDSFDKLKDFYSLKHDSKNLSGVINILENPELFSYYAARTDRILKSLHDNRLKSYKTAMDAKTNAEEFNQLINDIFEEGAYFDSNDLQAFVEGNIPPVFYDATDGSVINPNSEKYSKIIALIDNFKKATGKTEEPVTEEAQQTETIVTEQVAEPIITQIPITIDTPVKDMPEDLVAQLVDAYVAWNRERYEKGEEIADDDIFEKSQEQIAKSLPFKEFMKFPKSGRIIREYNNKTGRKIGAEIPLTEEKKVNIMTSDMRNSLITLGYEKSEINKMSFPEAQRLIAGSVKKGEEERLKIQKELQAKQELEEKKAETVATMQSLLQQADTVTKLNDFYDNLRDMIREQNVLDTGVTSDELEAMFDERRKELVIEVNFDNIVKGEAVMMKNSKDGLMVVEEKLADRIKLRKFGDPTAPIITVMKQHVKDTILYKDDPNAKPQDITSEISQENKDISNQDIQTAQNLNDPDQIKKDVEKGKRTSNKDLDNDLLNNIGCD